MYSLTNSVLFTNFSNSPLPILTTSSRLLALPPWSHSSGGQRKRRRGWWVCVLPPGGILSRRSQWVGKDLFPAQTLVRCSVPRAPLDRGGNVQRNWVQRNWTLGMNLLLPEPCQQPWNITAQEEDSNGLLARSQKLVYNWRKINILDI